MRFLTRAGFGIRDDSVVRAQRQHFSQHAYAVVNKPHLAAFMMIPAHWNFPEPQSRSLREQKQLHVKAKADDFRSFDNWPARFHAKRFEAALCIPKWQTSREAHQQIKNAHTLFASPRLPVSD